MSVFLDMAHDGGYRGDEALEVAQRLEHDEMVRAYAAEAQAEDDNVLADTPEEYDYLPF